MNKNNGYAQVYIGGKYLGRDPSSSGIALQQVYGKVVKDT